ncbi:MAG TPA: SpoIIE family protein phosphatase [Candidatus Acidoferrales bacterium]|nr:SpoIIE family protein phosphatase [Candidatus Acidoferrales bacterium]
MVWDCTLQSKSETHADSTAARETASGFRVLIADDQADVLEALRLLLKSEGYELELVNSPAALLAALARRPFDLVLMDLNYARDTTSGREGLDLLSQIHGIDALLPIVAMTAWGSVELAVEIMREGVRDFVLKPWDNARLLRIVKTEIARGTLARKEQQSQAESRAREVAQGAGEWQEAERTQLGFLPKEIPQIPGCEFSGAWLPVHGIGGDYFDVLQLDSEHFAFCIADVAGKGIAAALLMSNLQATVRNLAGLQPAELTARVNRFIRNNTAPDRFITFFYAVFNAASRELVYTNAGHNAPVRISGDGAVTRLGCGGQAMGISSKEAYEQEALELMEGDRLILFTDGVTEAADSRDEEEFGEERLLEILRESRALKAAEIQTSVLARVAKFTGAKFQDDATLIVLAVN